MTRNIYIVREIGTDYCVVHGRYKKYHAALAQYNDIVESEYDEYNAEAYPDGEVEYALNIVDRDGEVKKRAEWDDLVLEVREVGLEYEYVE